MIKNKEGMSRDAVIALEASYNDLMAARKIKRKLKICIFSVISCGKVLGRRIFLDSLPLFI